ncbi:MAG TPA: peptidoglycan DD-metalloendopeptidase family protein [Gammaproteobacteria bacterium]|nr:peptidoglycan DD-metalloendopeptidase family protein [Gammaproteobacteria bacterium]
MNYLSSLRRYFRLPIIQESSTPRFPHLHWLVLLASLIVLGIVLGLTSNDAKATRSERAFWTDTHPSGTPERIILPLQVPTLKPATPLSAINFRDAALLEKDWHTLIVNRGDNLSSMFMRLGLSPQQVRDVLDLGAATATLTHLLPGQTIKVRIDRNNELQELIYDVDEKSLHIHRDKNQLQATDVSHTLETRVSYAAGVIQSSLFESAQDAGLSDNKTLEMAGIFGWDIDFAQDLRRGDSFTVMHEEYYLNGEKVRDGPIVAVEFTNRGKTYRAVRFQDGSGEANYFTPQGLSMRKAFLRTPVKFSRISSTFSTGRFHPVLHRMRAHHGVDYAAPTGTPIKAASDGKVVFKGVKGGYGNTLVLQHAGKNSTLYAHLVGFARGLNQGSTVRQGQIIGYVGQSGLATGPHLHYEFRIDGAHRDPLTVTLPKAEPILAKYRDNFSKQAGQLFARMDLLKNSQLAQKSP